MKLGRLDHVNIRTGNIQAMRSWYESILGMEAGYRPPFSVPGVWLYADGQAAVHLIDVSASPANGEDLQLEHFAFRAEGFGEFKAHLERNEVHFVEAAVPGIGVTQLNVWDPDGNHIHVDFETT